MSPKPRMPAGQPIWQLGQQVSLQEVDSGRLADEPLRQGRVGLQGVALHQKAPAETDGLRWNLLEGYGGPVAPQPCGRTQAAWAGAEVVREQDTPLPRLLERGQH